MDETQFRHTLSKNILVMETEVTQGMWANLKTLQGTLPSDPSQFSAPGNPANQVSWYEAILFANLLSLQQGLNRVYYSDSSLSTPVDVTTYTSPIYVNWDLDGYRLPTEGEQEYFIRASTTGLFSFEEPAYNSDNCGSPISPPVSWVCPASNELPVMESYSWFCSNSGAKAGLSGAKNANPWGLKDVHGNIWEWGWDWAGTYPVGDQIDYRGPSTGTDRVFRSGGWNNSPRYLRSASRGGNSPEIHGHVYGFRLVRNLNHFSISTTSTTSTMTSSTTSSSSTTTTIMSAGALWAVDGTVGNLRYVPAGTFMQGTPLSEFGRYEHEGPQFTHNLTKNIAVMETEVSRQMWIELRWVQDSLPPDPTCLEYGGGTSNPVQYVNWFKTILFSNLLSLQRGLRRVYYIDSNLSSPIVRDNYETNNVYVDWNADGFRLPTEGEWEYFARAGTTGPFSVNETAYNSSNYHLCTTGLFTELEKVAWFCANAGTTTHTVGSKLSNPWGLKDVHGNVCEWVWDYYSTYPKTEQTNYRGPSSGSYRTVRGGDWNSTPAYFIRSGSRLAQDPSPSNQSTFTGFRLVRVAE